MPKRFQYSDFIDPGALQKLLDEIAKISPLFAEQKEKLKAMVTEINTALRQVKLSGGGIEELDKLSGKARQAYNAYNQLNQSQRQFQTIERQITSELTKQTPEFRKKYVELQKLREETKRLNQEDLKHAGLLKQRTGLLKGIGSTIKSLVVSYLSLYAVIRLVNEVFSRTKALNVLSQSYKYLIRDTKELAESQKFLAAITENYGLEIISTSNAYLKFRASIQGANFDLNEADKIFKSVAKAGAVLGLSAERMELTFLALEQMISKGTVSTEELRRQLGDNLPGAVQIMADALDVSIPKLLQMVKANEVLANEALPKFADQLEKTYGIENVNRIENMQAAVNRLKNAWTEFVEIMDKAGTFTKVLELLFNIIERISFEEGRQDFFDVKGAKLASQWYEKIIKDAEKYNDVELRRVHIIEQIHQANLKDQKNVAELLELNKKKTSQLSLSEEKRLMQLGSEHIAYLRLTESLNEYLNTSRDGADEQVEDQKGIIATLKAQIKSIEELIEKETDSRNLYHLQQWLNKLNEELHLYENMYDILNKARTVEIDYEKETKRWAEETAAAITKSIEDQADALAKFAKANEEFLNSIEEIETAEEDIKDIFEAVNELVQNTLGILYDYNQALQESLNKEVSAREKTLDKLYDIYDDEKKLKDEGKANDLARITDQIAEEQRLLDEGNKKLAQAQKREAQIQLASQASNIITATSKLILGWEEVNPVFGWIIAMAQAVAMLGSFLAYKNKVESISKYGEGGEVEGRSHKEGGTLIEAEGGEFVTKKRAAEKSKSLLEMINDEKLDDSLLLKLNIEHGLKEFKGLSTRELIEEMREHKKVSSELLKAFKGKKDITVLKITASQTVILEASDNGNIVKIRTINK